MRVDPEHGGALAARLSSRGATLIEKGGLLFWASFHDMPLRGYELDQAEEAARDVLAAIEAYRQVVETADPVITWERPRYHRQAGNASAESFDAMIRSKRRCAECGMYEATDDAPMCEPCRDYMNAVQPTGQVLR